MLVLSLCSFLSVCIPKNVKTRLHAIFITFYGFDPAEAPPLEPFDEEAIDCTIDSGTLAGMVARSLFAAAVEHTRYAINGVLFDRVGRCRRIFRR